MKLSISNGQLTNMLYLIYVSNENHLLLSNFHHHLKQKHDILWQQMKMV